ncbi:MAG TPA: dTMP kinase [Gemmatimonadales bacterium]
MARGCFVVLEGPEGSGKSTLAPQLAEWLRNRRIDVLLVREPGSTPVAEALRAELLVADRHWTPEMELLYYVTARADHVTHVIRPALEAGRLVMSDRYEMSTRAYQGAGRGVDRDHLEWVNRAATGGLVPDLTLVLALPADTGLERLRASGRRPDRLDRESLEFHRRVAAYYQAVQGPGIRHLDATQPLDQLLPLAVAELRAVIPQLVLEP